MPFTAITGSFHLVGRTAAGNPSGFSPDGDSMQFKPDQPQLLNTLDQVGRPYKLSSIGSTQLRFEGIDALELHYAASHQPRPLADEAREYLTGRLALNPVPYRAPELLRVKPPVERDGTRGYILTRALEANGRPVAFAFAGGSPHADGSDHVFLDAAMLRTSLNYRSVQNGHAYPLFYDTLFADLRGPLATAARNARTARKGLWPSDRTTSGVSVGDQADLERSGVVFPKLFRRLTAFLAKGQGTLPDFPAFLVETREQVLQLGANSSFTHFDTLVEVKRAHCGPSHLALAG